MTTESDQKLPARGASGRRRSAARLAAVQALYQIDLTGVLPGSVEVEKVISEFVRDRLGKEIDGDTYNEADEKLFVDIVRGACNRLSDLDGMIASALSPEWPFERLETVLRAVLRAGGYELLARADVPPRVVISEYLDVAHAFFGGKEPGLVNGVLDRLAHVLRSEEIGRDRGL
jgi:N utilization substance protein B